MILLRPGDYKVMPWKNGLGTTTEIYRADGADGEMDWRVSIASVATDGPFSTFPGYDRHIMVIGGNGMVLHGGPGGPIEVTPTLQPCRFSGDWTITATLIDGPVTDFNLIARRAAVGARMEVVLLDRPADIGAAGETCLVYALKGSFEAGGIHAAAGCSVVTTLDGPLHILPGGGAATIAVCAVSADGRQ